MGFENYDDERTEMIAQLATRVLIGAVAAVFFIIGSLRLIGVL